MRATWSDGYRQTIVRADLLSCIYDAALLDATLLDATINGRRPHSSVSWRRLVTIVLLSAEGQQAPDKLDQGPGLSWR